MLEIKNLEQSIIAAHNFLNELEIKGGNNVAILYKTMYILEGILGDIEKNNSSEKNKDQLKNDEKEE